MNKPKIKIVQYMHGSLEYFPWSEWINRRYCERHGYTYVVRRDQPRTDRHVIWHKISVILDELRDCDYLLFVDADAVFYAHELTIENELIPELQEQSILMAQDCGSESLRWCPGLPNSGVILMKNDDRVKEIITEWNRVTEIDEETRWKWPPTQRALRTHILPKYKNDLRTALDYYLLQGQRGQFIRHYCLYSDEKRAHAMKNIYKRLTEKRDGRQQTANGSRNGEHDINSSSTQPVIKVVQYHWGEQNHSYQMTRKINEAYCRRHGYEFVVKTFVPRDDRAWRWSKIPAMREELHDCDFLLYLDADAFFYSHELRIEEELLPLLNDKQIMMSANTVCERSRHQPDKPNTGVVLVRNSDRSAEMLRMWDETSECPGMEGYRFGMQHEQDTCFPTIWHKYASEVKLLKDYYLMNGLRGIFIRHLMGMKDDDRLEILKKFLIDRRGLIPVADNSTKLVS